MSEYEELAQKADEARQKVKDLQAESQGMFVDGSLPAGQFEAYQEIADKIKQAKEEESQLVAQAEKGSEKYNNNVTKLEEINQKLKENAVNQGIVNTKIDEANTKLAQAKGYNKVKEELSSINDKMSGIIKKVAKWALAVFSVRSAYTLIRQASSTLSQYNEQYATDLEYIKYVLAQTLAPVLQYLVNLAYKLLTYINYIASAWFNINLFGNASAKSFQSMKNSASSTAKSAKEIENSLAGFDEMNILSDTSSSSSTSDGGVTAPSVDLSNLDVEIPEWLQWIANNKDTILDFFTLLGSIIAGIKIGDLLYNLGLVGEKLSFIQKLGIGVAIFGVIKLVKDLADYFSKLDGSLENNGTNWKDFGKIIVDVGIILGGLALAIGSVPLAIAAAITLILGLLAKNWDTVKGWFENAEDFITGLITKVQEWFIKNIDTIQEKFGYLGVGIMGTITALVSWILEIVKGVISMVKELLNGLFTGVKQILDGILLIIKGNFKQGIISILKGIANVVIGILNSLISGINAILYPVRALIAGLGTILGKNWTINTVKIPTIKYLKTGGIVNLPRKRSTSWRSNSTEKQEENGVIPLTDSQKMEMIGEAIGKYVTINANIVNNMNGRVISRQLQKIQGNQDFAYNT